MASDFTDAQRQDPTNYNCDVDHCGLTREKYVACFCRNVLPRSPRKSSHSGMGCHGNGEPKAKQAHADGDEGWGMASVNISDSLIQSDPVWSSLIQSVSASMRVGLSTKRTPHHQWPYRSTFVPGSRPRLQAGSNSEFWISVEASQHRHQPGQLRKAWRLACC